MAETDETLTVSQGEDGATVVDLNPEVAPPIETVNFAELLYSDEKGRKWLEKQARHALREYEEDLDSSRDYRERIANEVKLFSVLPDVIKGGPADGTKMASLPIMSKVALRIWSRVNQMAQAVDPIAVPTGEEDQERAADISKHLGWQRRAKNPNWGPGMSASIMQWVVRGSMFRWTDWDPIREAPVVECLTASDLVLPYAYKDTSPCLEDVEHYTRVRRMTRQQLEQLEDVGHYWGVGKLFPPTEEDGESPADASMPEEGYAKAMQEGEPKDDPIQDIVDELQGVEMGKASKENGRYVVLERIGWARLPFDLPGEEGSPRRLRPVRIVIEKTTKRVLRLVLRERDNPLDRKRYERESMHANLRAQNTGEPPKMPRPPRKEVVHPAVHYQFFPNPEGIYGFGVGLISAGANEIANVLMTEDIVARRISNVSQSTGFTSKEIAGEKGALELQYGKFKGLDVPVADLPNVVHPLKFNPPPANSMVDIEKLESEVESAMSATGIMSGEAGPSHETAAAAKARQMNAMTAITAAMENFLTYLSAEFRNYARMNAVYMSDVEYFWVTEPDPENPRKTKRQRREIGREAYTEDYDISFSADARLAMDPGEGMSALQAYDLLKADPLAAQNPNLMLKALKKALRALKAADLASELPDEVPPPEPPSPMSQEQETAGFMNEQDHPVLDDDDDEDHLRKMGEFRSTGMYQQLSPTGKQIFDRHERAHNAQAYLKAMQIKRELEEQGGLVPSII